MTSAAPKRSLFSKPSWTTSSAPVAETDDDAIFGRSQIYEDIIAEKRRKKEKQLAKTKARQQSEGREPKRRRISNEEEDEDDDDDDSDASSTKSGEGQRENERREDHATRSTPSKTKFAAALDSPVKPTILGPAHTEATPILLDDDDDIQITATNTAVRPVGKRYSKAIDDAEDDQASEGEDEYDRKLKRIAREHALARQQAETKAKPPTEPLASGNEAIELSQGSPAVEGSIQTKAAPQVRILITSIYPNTNDLIVSYSASRALKQVKEVWCKKQGFSDEKTRSFFFTWNGAKLFDSSNLMHTLEALKAQRPNEDDPSGGKIHLEAMNAEILEHRKQQKQREEAEAARPSHHQEREEDATPEAPPPLKEPRCVIRLRAEGMEDLLMRVRPTTPIGKIMQGFAQQRNVEAGRTCWLFRDGDRLEPDSTVRDAEIEDEDVVEVTVR